MKTFALIVALLSIGLVSRAAQTPIKDLKVQNSLDMSAGKITNVVDILDTNGVSLLGGTGGNGSGNVTGPVSSQVNNVAAFANTSGQLLKDTGIPYATIIVQTALNTVSNQLFTAVTVTNGAPAAVIQSVFNSLTNGGTVSFFPGGTYPITNTLTITNRMSILGNGARLTYAAGLTNKMMTTGTNFHGNTLMIDGLIFDGGVLSAYNDASHSYADPTVGGRTPWFNPSFTNRTGLLVDAAGGVRIQRCTFVGWPGFGCMAIQVGGTLTAQHFPKFEFVNNRCYTNFGGVFATANGLDITYYNSDASTWGPANAAPEYSLITGNDVFDNQFGIIASAGNALVFMNQINGNALGLSGFSGNNSQHGNYNANTLNHNTVGIYFEGPSTGGTFRNNVLLANGAIAFNNSPVGIDFRNNTIGSSGLYFTNGATGIFADNVYDVAAQWGVTFTTNFAPTMIVSGNRSMDGTNTDGSALSLIVKKGDGSGLTNLIHGSTVSGVSGVSVALTQNQDGSTNYGLTVTAGGSGTVTSVDVAEQGYTSSGAITGAGTSTLTQTADKNHLGFSETNISNVGLSNKLRFNFTWYMFREASTNSLIISNIYSGAVFVFTSNGPPIFDARWTTNLVTPPSSGATNLVGEISTGAHVPVSYDIFAKTNQILDASALTANHHAGTGPTTNLMNQEDFTGYTNNVSATNYNAGTNIVATFDGNLHSGVITNGPDVFITFAVAGNAAGSWSWRIVTNCLIHLPAYDIPFLAGSNATAAHIFSYTNGVLSLTSYGGTNGNRMEAAGKEN